MTRLALVAAVLSLPLAAHAQCDCDHTIEVGTTGFDGREIDVAPGDRICVMAGEHAFIRFQHVQGTADDPVVITNCGGLARIHNEDRAYALVFEEDSMHFHLTGTGDPEVQYGFEISAPDREPYPGVGLWLLGRSTDYEVDHVEIHDTGFAGVSAKTDPLCDGSADRDVFVQRNARFHHMWVHDTGGEGFYVGSTQTDGQRITCDGAEETRFPHYLEGVEIHDVVIEDTGWDGAQIGQARERCRFYRNVIRRVGLEGVEFQQQGLQIGDYSACEIFDNVIEDGPANGIIVLGAGDTFVHSNVIRGFTMADGIYANARDRVDGATWRFAFNTIIGWDRNGITVFGPTLGASGAWSNLLVGGGAGVGAGGDVDWAEDGNVVVASEGEAGFVGDDDLHLEASSPAVGAGVAVEGVGVDLEGYPRASPPSAGAYEYRDPTVDAGAVTLRDGGTTDGGGGGDDGGCRCRAAPGGAGWLGWLLPVAALLRSRRRLG